MLLELRSKILCPNCGHEKEEVMMLDACQYTYACENCKSILKAAQVGYCIFCTFGSTECPQAQVYGLCSGGLSG